jgi:hypothetical protein
MTERLKEGSSKKGSEINNTPGFKSDGLGIGKNFVSLFEIKTTP